MTLGLVWRPTTTLPYVLFVSSINWREPRQSEHNHGRLGSNVFSILLIEPRINSHSEIANRYCWYEVIVSNLQCYRLYLFITGNQDSISIQLHSKVPFIFSRCLATISIIHKHHSSFTPIFRKRWPWVTPPVTLYSFELLFHLASDTACLAVLTTRAISWRVDHPVCKSNHRLGAVR